MLRRSVDFRFLQPGPLIDRELELVAPHARYIGDLVTASAHPLSRADPQSNHYTREKIVEFLRIAPGGHQPGQSSSYGPVPVYHFWMKLSRVEADSLSPLSTWGVGEAPLRIGGTIGLRIGAQRELEMYYGHFGYNVFPVVRGNRYAERACRLLLPLARAHGMRTIWITCNPDNLPSRRTCERLGCTLVEIVSVPAGHALYLRGEREKCRYRLDL